MNMLSEWWKQAGTDNKIIQLLVFFLMVSVSLDRTVAVSVSTGAVLLYIVRDCIKHKSSAGFYSPCRNWLGIVVFIFTVLLASVLLGDMGSIHIALRYTYWTLPFFLMVYFANRADTKYAVVAGAALAVVISFVSVIYLALQGFGTAGGRVGAFDANPNHYAFLLGGILPVLFCALYDTKVKAGKTFKILNGIIIVAGLLALWKTGSRGAMGGLFAGALFVLFLVSYIRKNTKLFLKGIIICAAVISIVLFAGIPGGTERIGDKVRLRQLQSCYAMWKDHMALGVGLNNWRTQYSTSYVQAEVIKREAARRYEARQKTARKRAAEKKAAAKKTAVKKAVEQKPAGSAVTQKPAVKEKTVKKAALQKPKAKVKAEQKAAPNEAARKEAFQNRILNHEAELPIPHNVIAWFFSTTGIIGGMGYLFFVFYYLWRLYRKVAEEPENWVAIAGLWVFVTVNFHGLFDAGITNKGAARLLYLMLGLALSYCCCKKQEGLTEKQNG